MRLLQLMFGCFLCALHNQLTDWSWLSKEGSVYAIAMFVRSHASHVQSVQQALTLL